MGQPCDFNLSGQLASLVRVYEGRGPPANG